MSESASQIVSALFQAFSDRDVEAAIALSHPAGELWVEGTAGQVERTEPYRGHAGVREYFADLDRAWDEITVYPGDLRVAAGGVVAFGTVRVRPIGASETVELPVIWVFKLREGLVVSARVVSTAAEAEDELRSA